MLAEAMEFSGYRRCGVKPRSQSFRTRNNFLDIINNFKRIPIRDWSYMDTLDWAAGVCKKNAIPLNDEVSLTVFQNISGQDLLGFSAQDFSQLLGHVHGPFFFEQFQRFRIKQGKRHQEECGASVTSESPDSKNMSGTLSKSFEALQLSSKDFSDLESSIPYSDLFYANATSGASAATEVYPDSEYQRNDTQQRFSGAPEESFQRSSASHSPEVHSLEVHSLEVLGDTYSSPYTVDDQNQWSTSAHPVDQSQWSNPYCSSADQREQLSWPSSSAESPANDIFESIPTNKKRGRTRGPKSWEFLLRLLTNPLSNPRLVEWVDRDRGVFRLVDKDEVARLWGTREYKGREKQANLTYENFSRALRYYYSSKTLLPVFEKNCQYQFGPKIVEMIKNSDQ